MATSRSSPLSARFDQFEVDLSCKELRKSGARVPVQEQPFQLLQLLLDAEGRVVTREQLRNALWSADTFVDFEHSVNVAIGKLRHALGDSPDDPKFIETLPKLGYRFIVPVEWVPDTGGAEGLHIVAAAVRTGLSDPPEIECEPIRLRWWKRKATLAATACTAIALMLYLWVAPRIEQLLRLHELQQLTVVPLTTLPGLEYSPTFSPDGSQVAFVWDEGRGAEGFDLYVKVIGTDKPLRLTRHGGVGHAAWSPDGRSIAFWRRNQNDAGVFVISPLGGPEHKITSANRSSGGSLSWSADGRQLAFIDHPSDSPLDDAFRLYVISLDSMKRVLVKTDCDLVRTPAFSPRGDYLAWACGNYSSDVSIHLQRLIDGSVTQLLQSLDGVWGLAWSSDGRRILFSTGGSGELWELALARPNHQEKLPIGSDASSIAVSPKGDKVAFTQTRANTNIWRVNLSEGQAHAQKVVASSREQIEPRYSPDGTRIAFGSNRSGSREVWVSDADGSNAVQLSSFGVNHTGSPRWSPNGKLIAFDSRAGGEANIYIVDPQGGVPKKLNVDIHGNCVPAWSHDGAWIYFVNGADADEKSVWKVPSEGGHAVQVAQHEATIPVESPDGRYVYFTRDRWLWRVNSDGTGEQQVQGMPQLSGQSDRWIPFGSGIYFVAGESDGAEIDFFDLDTKEIRPVFVLNKHPPEYMGGLSVSSDGRWLLYAQLDELASDLMLIENWR